MGGRLNWSKGEPGSKRKGCNLGQDPGNVPSEVTFSPSFQPKLGGVPARAGISDWQQEYATILGKKEFDLINPHVRSGRRLPTLHEAWEQAKRRLATERAIYRESVAQAYHGWDTLNISPTEEWTVDATEEDS